MSQPTPVPTTTAVAERRYDIRFPKADPSSFDQDEEFCQVEVDGETRRIRFHDYHELYEVPGLYEQLFYTELKCDSPVVIADMVKDHLKRLNGRAQPLRALDVGAGNGMVGEELRRIGVDTVVGADIIEEAAAAAERDRPEVYDEYFVVDLTDIPADEGERLEEYSFNCLTTVAALGFGDIPPDAFAAAYNLCEVGSLVAFNIKERFIKGSDGSGFSQLIEEALEDGSMTLLEERRYRHRLSVAGEPLHYMALLVSKQRDLPLSA